MEANKLTNISIKEYIKIEQEGNLKYEYHNGSIFAMAGGTIHHGLIIGNIYSELKSVLKRRGKTDCTALTSELKLHIESMNKFLYPDGMVVCGGLEQSEKEPNAIVNPIVIIEVLSTSTESYDRGDKFHFYRQIPDLKEYVLIDQYQAKVEVYQRAGDMWRIKRLEGLDEMLLLASIDATVSLNDIYEGVSF